jgi:hypothetical protein
MSAVAELVNALIGGGMDAAAAAALVARAVVEAGNALRTVTGNTGNALPVTRSRKAINQANYRARKSAAKPAKIGESVAMAAVSESATAPVTPGNATATPVISAPLSILSSFELSQGNPKEEVKEVVRSTEPRARVKRGARLPDDWQPSNADHQFAAGRGLRLYEIEIEATKFRNYWTNRTDKQAAKPRWDRAWQNWILNVRKAPNGPEKSVLSAFDRLEQRLTSGDDYALREDDLLSLPPR